MKVYRIITTEEGIKQLETKITALINHGWEAVGGVGFNQSYPYQAMIGEILKSEENRDENENSTKKMNLGAVAPLPAIDKKSAHTIVVLKWLTTEAYKSMTAMCTEKLAVRLER